MVDTRKYAAGAYLKPADVETEGTMHKRIVNVAEMDGKFGPKLDCWFEDGSRISLSGKNVGELNRVYGTESDTWLGMNVELHVEEYENRDGKIGKMIVLAAIDPEVPPEERPKPTPLPPEPKVETPKKSLADDMDDEMPF